MTDSTLTISRLIRAPRAVVWSAWSDPAHFAKWWLPEPLECKVVKMELRPGGGFETQIREGQGEFQPHVEGCFLHIEPMERLVFTTVLKEGWQPLEPWLAMTSVVTMTDEDGGTRYVAQALHRSPEERARHDDLGFHDGWGTVIDQLARLAASLTQ